MVYEIRFSQNKNSPLKISLDSIKSNSNVGAIDVIVERIYPLQYFETKEDGSKICRNQKQEEQLNYKSQIEYEQFNYKNSCHDEIDYELNNNNETNVNKSNHLNQRVQPQQKPLQSQRNVKQILKIRLVDAYIKNKDSVKNKTCKEYFSFILPEDRVNFFSRFFCS